MTYKISIIDRNSIFLDLLKIVLEAHGYFVKTSPNYSLAKDLVEIWEPNLIILDSNILVEKSAGFIDYVEGSTSIPILLLATPDGYPGILDSLKACATGYIYKPVNHTELLRKISDIQHGLEISIT